MATTNNSDAAKKKTKGIRCDGEHPRRRGQECGQLLVAFEGTCPRCHKPYALVDLLRKAEKLGYPTQPDTSLIEKKEEKEMSGEIKQILEMVKNLSREEQKELLKTLNTEIPRVVSKRDIAQSVERQKSFIKQLIERTRREEIIWTCPGSRTTAKAEEWEDWETSFSTILDGMRITCIEYGSWMSGSGSGCSYELQLEKDGEAATLTLKDQGWFTPKLIKKLYKLLRERLDKEAEAKKIKTEEVNRQKANKFINEQQA